MSTYRPRIYDTVLREHLEAAGAVLVEGPKWCGKTTTCEQLAASAIYLHDPEKRDQYAQLADLSPSSLLEGETPRLIDEWQTSPQLWDAVRFAIDKRRKHGQFVLTGSVVPPDTGDIQHTGTGRIARLRMRTMSLFESGDSSGAVSMEKLFVRKEVPVSEAPSNDLEHVAYLICRGGWPDVIGYGERIALRQSYNYLDALVSMDISAVDSTKRDEETARMLLRSYARMVSSHGSYRAMLTDLTQAQMAISEPTFLEYVHALGKLFVTEDLTAWNPNLRSKTAIRTSPTRHFTDPSIPAAALGTSPAELMEDLETFGLLFEDLAVRDLRVYADLIDGDVFHFRDKSGLECDGVIRLRNGHYGLVEVKLGGKKLIDEGVSSLLKVAEKLDPAKMPEPSFLMVLTATGDYAYQREDGVIVVPITTLGP
ncbi:MAG: DUF4143 domain-containing protein [Corynebacterium sp.]|nr:DUF4143 domain-containing protein [Corynebacterium sp.]